MSNKLAPCRYRSDALQLEVQLSEALSHVNKGSSNGESPSTVGTAVCLCLLSQIAEKNGPFQVVLAPIKDELEGAIYSDEFNADSGTKWLDQVRDAKNGGLVYFTVGALGRSTR